MQIHRTALIAGTLFAALLASASRAPRPPAMPPDLDRAIAAAVRDWDVPGLGITIVKNDRVVAARGYGARERGRPEPVDGETIFDIASLTKSFTAAGAAVLVDAGKLRWDDRVRERLPASRSPIPTSITNLLCTVAGELAAAAAGTSWAELIRTRLVEPAGMTSTTDDARPSGSNVARPHAVIGGVQQPIRPFDFSMVGPASSIYTNAVDMARWLRLQLGDGMLDGKQIISRASMLEMHSPQVIIATTPEQRRARLVEHFAAYGLGWQIMDYRGEPILWHSGNADGMPSYMAILAKQKLGVAVMINTWAAPGLHGALASRIIDHYLGVVPPRDWSGEALARYKNSVAGEAEQRRAVAAQRAAAAPAERSLADYAGTYAATLWGEFQVRLQEKGLVLEVGNGDSADLAPWDHDTFLVAWHDAVLREVFYDTLVTFRTGEDGPIGRLSMTLNRDQIEAARRP